MYKQTLQFYLFHKSVLYLSLNILVLTLGILNFFKMRMKASVLVVYFY